VTQTQHCASRLRLRAGLALSLVALATICLTTLTPVHVPSRQTQVLCVICGERGLADVLVNVILFWPLGIGLALLRLSPRRCVLLGALISGTIETLQTVIPGRDPSVGDVLFNTIGVGVGLAVVALFPILAGLKARTSGRCALATSLGLILVIVVTGTLLRPSLPQTTYWGQWTPNFANLAWYRGRVVSARLAGREIQSARIEDSRWARDALLAGGPIEVEAIAGPPVSGLAPIFSVADNYGRGIVLVGPDRDDLVFRYRTEGTRLTLNQPDVRVVDGMKAVQPGSYLSIRVSSPRRGRYCLEGPHGLVCDLGFSPGNGWAMLSYPEGIPNWLRRTLCALWVAALVAPTGFLMRGQLASYAALAIVALSLIALPALVELRSLRWYEWLGALVGLATARVVSSLINRRTSPNSADGEVTASTKA